jgi:hypothetical protein
MRHGRVDSANVRPYILAALAGLCAFAQGDRLIDIPLGRKIPSGVIRLEGQFDQSDASQSDAYLDWGVDSNWEASLHYENPVDARGRLTGDLSYNLIPPITGISPGISVGVQDLANNTGDGRRFYAASTFKVDGTDLWTPVELTLGASYDHQIRPFVGLSFPLDPRLRLMAEHDGFRISAGAEYKPTRNMALRWVVRGSVSELSLRLTTKL